MKESVGSIPIYNIIFTFLVITFAFLAGTISYSKAFRVNTRIIHQIERVDGYNPLASRRIDSDLRSFGYSSGAARLSSNCPRRGGQDAIRRLSNEHFYCVYRFEQGDFKYYGVLTYMYFDLPLIGTAFSIPVYTRTDRLYYFPEEFPHSERRDYTHG